ncbi:NADH-quinone oxidoreductase subunit C [Cohnella sp. GCM10027633]|uniref:NADH-quinone oxidoreductase subunit C n=1 Tax=unclassified Cohnella TaxID=2636738 RepID=UPI003635406D
MSEDNENKPNPEQPGEPVADRAGEPAAAEAVPAGEGANPAPAAEGGDAPRKETDEEKAARRKAAFEAKQAAKAAAAQAAAEAAKAAQQANAAPADAAAPQAPAAEGAAPVTEETAPPPQSPNQPRLNRVVALLRELVAEDAVEESYINEPNDHLPTLVVKNEHWLQAARLFRNHTELSCNYLRNVSGVDYETHMEVVYYPLNMNSRDCYCIKVRADRESPSVASVTPVWETANWNEREIYDLLGIDFPGHPDLRRIMMPDDWEGHPLRKDYVPLDPEV